LLNVLSGAHCAKKRLVMGVSSHKNASPNLPAELCQVADTKLFWLCSLRILLPVSTLRALPITEWPVTGLKALWLTQYLPIGALPSVEICLHSNLLYLGQSSGRKATLLTMLLVGSVRMSFLDMRTLRRFLPPERVADTDRNRPHRPAPDRNGLVSVIGGGVRIRDDPLNRPVTNVLTK
jgi:hypothetical protein